MKKLIIIMVLSFFTSTLALAGPPEGKGFNKNHGVVKVDKSFKHDGVVSSGPPGLQGNTPPGLAKQGKTPHGWSQGEKTGWDNDTKDTNTFSRTWDRFMGWWRKD